MPNIKINREEFESLLGEEVTEETLEKDASFLGAHWNPVEGKKWDVEVYPDRPDLLGVEGLARAYRGFFGIDEGRENYTVEEGTVELEKDDSVEEVRPYIGCAVVRGLDLNERIVNGWIQMQEKLHVSFGRQRDKLAIGLHDLSSVEPPFEYRAVEPENVSFRPLEHDEELHLEDILEKHEKGKEYAWILEDEERYPIITDAEDKVLSFPPIINNQLTEVDTGTSDIFIDVTGKDRETVMKALNILATAMAERGGTIESVTVDGEEMPDLSPEKKELDTEYVRKISGLGLGEEEMAERLEKMRFGAEAGETIDVEVPAYRSDVMHSYDLIEDIVIAHDYREVEPEIPEVDTVGEEKDIEKFTDTLRDIFQGTGSLEAHTYVLSSPEKLFGNMEVEEEEIAEMANALTEDHSVARNWLLPGIMDVLNMNRHRSYPQKFFEIEDVVEIDDSDVGASNKRKAVYVEAGPGKNYTDARKVLQVIEESLGIELEVKESEKGCFKQQRSGKILFDEEVVGIIGEFSESVLENWELNYPAAGIEIDVEKLFEMY